MRHSHKIFAMAAAGVLLMTTPSCGQFFTFENPLVGEPAPDFKLKTVSGKELSMTQYRAGESAIIFFWATWCPHCRTQLKELNERKEELTRKGIKLVLVDIQETAQQVDAYLKKNKIAYDVFLDADQSVAEEYAIVGVPTFFFVGSDGLIKAVEHDIPSNYEQILAAK